MTTLTQPDLFNLQDAAMRKGDMRLFDQATSEHLHGGGEIANWRVLQAVRGNVFPFTCPLCRKTGPTFSAHMLLACEKRGYCTGCWTGVQIGNHWYEPWFFPKSRIRYLEAALAQGFKAKALQFPPDAPQRVRLRMAYRKAEALLHDLRQRLAAAQAGAPVVEISKEFR